MRLNINLFGASGFIGRNLRTELLTCHEVFSISLHDENWRDKLRKDAIFINLVGKAHDHNKTATKKDFFKVNVDFVKDIFDEFVRSEASVFIHISSLAALEEFHSKEALTEGNPCNPDSWYGKSKREAEIWLLNQKLPVNKKIIILRPPMVHGAGDKGNLGLLYKLISKGIPYPLASFKNKRSFISIDNFIFFIKEILNNHAKLSTGIYHISDDEPVSTMQIINIIKKVTHKNTPNLSLPKSFAKALAKMGDILPIPLNSIRLKKMTSDLILSNQKIKSTLGIKQLPQTAEEGLEKTITQFYKN